MIAQFLLVNKAIK